MNKLYIYAFLIIVAVGFIKWYSDNQYDAGYASCETKNVKAINEAVAKDRETEREKQDKADAEAQKQFDKINIINNSLNDELDRLRKRANRKQQPKNAKAICKGADGRSLSAEDAGFLAREAARADKIRAGLIGCYNYADSVSRND